MSQYLLWSGKMQGWFTTSGTYGSDLDNAARLPRDEALAIAKRHKTQAGHGMMPVRLEDLEAV